MPTPTATRPRTATAEHAYPDVTREQLVVGATTTAQVRALHELPALGTAEFAAILGTSCPGAPLAVVGRRTDGRAYDHLTIDYRADGAVERQTWTLAADRGAEVTYRLAQDTGARGGFAPLPR
ncbi:hypothetical protein ATJ88_0730 [Isoptericola jiangsuensis]|uniref:Uncharacterized protein n=1 Tax=Isoptericola jiangsuensis TaxID=548579 RepID=A0A2A9EUW6_9MICO|nr:hypothetical protein [Isoptericola jiangsuensis]PFG42080.1 hypothetical protein ATJ88_0730 [Isoptericola jiangsuensis]